MENFKSKSLATLIRCSKFISTLFTFMNGELEQANSERRAETCRVPLGSFLNYY